jgi:1,2-phenylacetyl-CoA epoxidase PaaB subunit
MRPARPAGANWSKGERIMMSRAGPKHGRVAMTHGTLARPHPATLALMSKIREQIDVDPPAGEIQARPTGDLRPYVIFTQLKTGGPHMYAGWLDAADDEMAIVFAKEHYGRDQECVGIWAVRRGNIGGEESVKEEDGTKPGPGIGTREVAATTRDSDSSHSVPFVVFTQKKPGDLHISAGKVTADSAERAIDASRQSLRQAKNAHSVWVVAEGDVISTQPDEVIWRNTDQTYRLARGYSRQVREKWATLRAAQDLAEYEKDDLAEAF